MSRSVFCRTARVVVAFVLAGLVVSTGCRKKEPGAALVLQKAIASGKQASSWLKTKQNEDGSFTDPTLPKGRQEIVKVGFTALASIALMDQDLDESDPDVKRAVAFITARQQPDGSIRMTPATDNYETALATIALDRTGNSAYDQALSKAQTYLAGLQRGPEGNFDLNSAQYGGFGYGKENDKSADLSNTHFALEALKATELGSDAETFKRAVTFIERCQNLKSQNKQSWATDDGGFVYAPGLSQANKDATGDQPRHSYGSMTYAGLLSFAYCDVPKDDPRVVAALEWLAEHWTLDENPGMGQQGLYYYYMVMAKALSAYGEKYFVDKKGVRHFWALELANKLIELQHPEGYWVNGADRWMENNKSLVTAYCMITLKRCRPFLEGN